MNNGIKKFFFSSKLQYTLSWLNFNHIRYRGKHQSHSAFADSDHQSFRWTKRYYLFHDIELDMWVDFPYPTYTVPWKDQQKMLNILNL